MGNQQFIQMKVDEIYEEQYATKVNESGVNTIIDGWKIRITQFIRRFPN